MCLGECLGRGLEFGQHVRKAIRTRWSLPTKIRVCMVLHLHGPVIAGQNLVRKCRWQSCLTVRHSSHSSHSSYSSMVRFGPCLPSKAPTMFDAHSEFPASCASAWRLFGAAMYSKPSMVEYHDTKNKLSAIPQKMDKNGTMICNGMTFETEFFQTC